MRALLLLIAALAGPVAAQEIRAFDAQTPAAIRKQLAGRPFVLALWSIHCEPCVREMPVWREMRAKHPGVEVILVSADPPAERERVRAFLARHDPGPVQRWQYADAFEERIRHAIDPKWRGELPRALFFDSAHRVHAHTGLLDAEEAARRFASIAVAK